MYGLDLMGAWGGDDSWDSSGGGDQWGQESWGGQGAWDGNGLRSMGVKYGRSLAVLSPAPVKVSNKYEALAEQTTTAINVPMAHLMTKARVDKRLRNKKVLCDYKPEAATKTEECICCPTMSEDFPLGVPTHSKVDIIRDTFETEWDSEVELDMEPMEGNTDDEQDWQVARASRRGGKGRTPATAPLSKSCLCESRAPHLLCSSDKCRNYNQRDRPFGSTTAGRVSTDDGSPRSTISTTSDKATPQPKPDHRHEEVPKEFESLNNKRKLNEEIDMLLKQIPEYLRTDVEVPNSQIVNALRYAGKLLERKRLLDYWLSDEGQNELLRKVEKRDRHPLNTINYSKGSKALLASAGASGNAQDGEWVQVELCADTGACDTVMPRLECPNIPITPSLQSIQGLEYEVADGHEIPNLGERQCVMWTEGATVGRRLNLQVADVHKALLSLSRCADKGFESRFGRKAGALIDEVTEEVIPLERKGNLYVLRCWMRAKEPEHFARPENR